MRSADLCTEEAIQRSIIQGLEAYGYTVFQTSRRVKQAQCPSCFSRFRPVLGGDGVTKGLPDLIVGRIGGGWGPRLMGIEVKGPKTKLSPEQRALAEARVIYIARSWEDARNAVADFESMNELSGPLSRSFLKETLHG